MVNIPFLGALAGCSARRSERRVASHTSEEQRRNAPGSAAKNGILAFSASLRTQHAGELVNQQYQREPTQRLGYPGFQRALHAPSKACARIHELAGESIFSGLPFV